MATQKTATRTYADDYQAVFDAVCRAAQAKGMTVKAADPSTGAIALGTSISFSTWGENVDVQVGQVQPGTIQVAIRSQLKFGLVDWGKNQKHLDALFGGIDQVLAGRSSTAAGGAWHPDPTGRHEHRWWDGTAWSDQVSDAGVVTTDPVEAR